ncbi:hypothetical protein PF002_g8821 [Phytophthora fragariae]|uniref:Uncharacterized protein n=1 Tax=Phytophthora fragariae TaxID=53985 RepID=A0A6A3ZYB6_9STRA|nr:hypothetical protein PF011_g6922 [Phytophthora fragariae]KAE9242293.1 hypothetical protein PF002_g8821 [Phytophthora fragariae]KAE9314720.1 hypothetical protein PF001_g8125 [Phytophthora fragariae]
MILHFGAHPLQPDHNTVVREFIRRAQHVIPESLEWLECIDTAFLEQLPGTEDPEYTEWWTYVKPHKGAIELPRSLITVRRHQIIHSLFAFETASMMEPL